MQIKLGFRNVELPRSKALRVSIGVALVLGGMLGMLPVLGFWMLPLGLSVLAVDLPAVRRFNRRLSEWWTGRPPDEKS
jgi:hypothetical protein